MSDQAITNFENRDTKYNYLLLLGLLVIFVISIVNAVDFRRVATRNDEISDTYFSVTYANVLFGINIAIAFIIFVVIIIVFFKILRGNKQAKEIQMAAAAANFVAAKANTGPSINLSFTGSSGTSANAAGVGFNLEDISAEELKEFAKINGIDVRTFKNKCSDGNTQLKCNPLTSDDVKLNLLYNRFYK
jgi:hypothetical protein